MKTLMILALLLLAAGASAQPPGAERRLDTRASRLEQKKAIVAQPERQKHELAGRPVTYSGIVVQAIKADHVLQLLNPAAPASYGNGENSVTREPKTGKVTGLKIFSIEF